MFRLGAPFSGVPGKNDPESGPNSAARRREVYALEESSRAPSGCLLFCGEEVEEDEEDGEEEVKLKREKLDEVLDGMNRSLKIVREGEGL